MFPTELLLQTPARCSSAPCLLQIYRQISACGCHYTSLRNDENDGTGGDDEDDDDGDDDVAVKLSIKYSSGGSHTSFFPWTIGQEGWRGVSSAARQPMESLACAHMSFSGQFLMTDIDVW